MPDLTTILTKLLDDSRRNPNSAIRTTLPRGLRVHARNRGGRFTLACSRAHPDKPSLKEWETVLAHLPQPLPDAGQPVLTEANGRWYMGCSWPVDELVQIGGA